MIAFTISSRRASSSSVVCVFQRSLTASSKKVEAAEQAEEWLKDDYDSLTAAMINEKFRELRSMK